MISVIIPTYNRETVIKDSILSVLNQTYTDLELIVADDCSTDQTAQVVKGLDDPRVRYICLDRNQGACAARNAGIETARGDLIAFQDSDDVWLPGKLERIVPVLYETGADVCFHKLRRHYPNRQRESYFPDLNESHFVSHEELCNCAMISTQTIIGRKEVFTEHKFDPLVKKSQDYDWAIRASRNNRFYYLNESLVEQYYQTDSISAQGIRVIKEMRQYFLKKYPEEARVNPQFELYQLLIIAKNKTILGENATEEYARIYELRKGKVDGLKVVLSRLGILPLVYKLKGDYHQKLP